MSKQYILDNLIKQNNGYLITSEAIDCGVSKTYLMEYVRKMDLIREAQGVYCTQETWPDTLYIIHLRNKQVCFSHETALYLHGLMDREPSKVTITAKEGYNASHLKSQGIVVHKVKADKFSLGITQIPTPYGHMVRTYDRERVICDIIKGKNKMDIQIFQTAIKQYISDHNKNLSNLMRYADMLGVSDRVKTYMEVLL